MDLKDRILFVAASLPGAQEQLVLAKFLGGTHDAAIDATDLPKRDGFGALHGHVLQDLVKALDQMVEGGWFVVEVVQNKKEGKVSKLKLTARARARIAEVQAGRLREVLHIGASRPELVQVLALTPEKVVRACLEALAPHEVRGLSQLLQPLAGDPAVKHRELVAGALQRAGVPGA